MRKWRFSVYRMVGVLKQAEGGVSGSIAATQTLLFRY